MVDEKTEGNPVERSGDEVRAHPDEAESSAPSDDVLEPTAGKGLPSYRPWDWLAGYGFALFVAILMFYLAESMYDLAQ